jgi:hypothetical protein
MMRTLLVQLRWLGVETASLAACRLGYLGNHGHLKTCFLKGGRTVMNNARLLQPALSGLVPAPRYRVVGRENCT